MLDESDLGRALTAMAQASPLGLAVLSSDGVVLHTNPAMAALLGTVPKQLLGRDVRTFLHPADRDGEQPPDEEEWLPAMRRRLVRADGTEAVVSVLVTPVHGDDGAVERLVVQTLPDGAGGSTGTAHGGRVPLRVAQARAVEQATSDLAGASTIAEISVVMERQVSAFEASGLLMALTDGPHLRVVSNHGYPDHLGALLVEQSPGGRAPMADVTRSRTPLYLETFEEYLAAYPHREPLARRSGKQAWAFLPLIAGGAVVGAWCLSFDGPHRFTVSERALLTSVSGLLAQALARSEVLEAERSLTRTLQRSLLPQQLPAVPGCEIAVRYSAAVAGLEVGGDFYDVIPLPNGGTGIVIGDAQGHSAAAAALMGQVRAALRAYAAEGHEPATIVARANRFLVTAGVDSFVTCTYAALDATHDGITFVRAGHPEPLLVTPDGGVGRIEVSGGLPLGIDPQATYPVTWVPLTVGCRVVLYTDGLVEHRRSDLAVGERALLHRMRAASGRPLQGFADSVLGGGADREDDVALLVLERVPDEQGVRKQATFAATSTDPTTVREVRKAVADRCREWGWAARSDEVELLVSELVTNAVVHVGGSVSVTVTSSTDQLTIAVADTSVLPPTPGRAGLWQTSGRGLSIVAEMADDWGVDPSGPGKSVWFSMHSAAS